MQVFDMFAFMQTYAMLWGHTRISFKWIINFLEQHHWVTVPDQNFFLQRHFNEIFYSTIFLYTGLYTLDVKKNTIHDYKGYAEKFASFLSAGKIFMYADVFIPQAGKHLDVKTSWALGLFSVIVTATGVISACLLTPSTSPRRPTYIAYH